MKELVVEVLREVAEYAADYGVRICSYPHARTYCETVSRSIELAKAVAHPNCGSMVTLCHLLKVEGMEKIDKSIKKSRNSLFAVTISGADKGDTRAMAWDKVIQPLGQGSFDVYSFLEKLWDIGYQGPVGIQYYGIKQDARTVIRSSVEEWQNYKNKYKQSRHDGEQQKELY